MPWVSDITYIANGEGWLYLTTVIGLFDGKVTGWALGDTMKATQTTIEAFKMAAKNRPISLFPFGFPFRQRRVVCLLRIYSTLGSHRNIAMSMGPERELLATQKPKDSFKP